jgi:creatinine amidohydrolase
MKWEDLTAPQFAKAVRDSKGVCILPIGVLEKHGNHLPLGTDFFTGRAVALEAARREKAVVFPPYFFGQIHEARHVPGTVALSGRLLLDLLFEVCSEIRRNGFSKILIFNSHGGNGHLLPYFAQLNLEQERGYGVYVAQIAAMGGLDPQVRKSLKDTYDGHAGEYETSFIQHLRPDLVHLAADRPSEGRVQKGLGLDRLYHGIWWYSESPQHYRGQARLGTAAKGKLIFEKEVQALSKAVRQVKADRKGPALMKKFFRQALKPR